MATFLRGWHASLVPSSSLTLPRHGKHIREAASSASEGVRASVVAAGGIPLLVGRLASTNPRTQDFAAQVCFASQVCFVGEASYGSSLTRKE